jgi:hypothetical protein
MGLFPGGSLTVHDHTSITLGGALSQASMPAGVPVQAVNATFSTLATNSTGTYADTGLTATITPQSVNNKVLVIVDVPVGKDTNNTACDLELFRGAVNISGLAQNTGSTGSAAVNFVGTHSLSILDSPASVSPQTYKVQFASHGSSPNAYAQAGGSWSSITLIEVRP